MADYIQSLDPRGLVGLETGLSFAISPFTAPPYNLPIFLFGVYAQESAESNQSLKLFTGLLGASVVFDIIWMTQNKQNWFIKLIALIILLLKGPTFFAFVSALRQRGEQFSGLNIRGGDVNGPTVWSMPGGFSSLAGGQGGYEDAEAQPRPAPATSSPHVPAAAPAPPSSQVPGGYQSL
ncbi:hypothetical protein EW145_g876 [Phellinidium pouzarii]|uniref:Uncharacterized protein n=1 Tax=Phellinidium pouzarii TaxID=167371 RepID=A0A4S4LHB0_9AGAM|nr:hypothetical protein EW145_g876 [Phellinidium pouzarii]